MITADINAIIFITGNITVIINSIGIALRTIFGPLSRGGQYIMIPEGHVKLVLFHHCIY